MDIKFSKYIVDTDAAQNNNLNCKVDDTYFGQEGNLSSSPSPSPSPNHLSTDPNKDKLAIGTRAQAP